MYITDLLISEFFVYFLSFKNNINNIFTYNKFLEIKLNIYVDIKA